MATNIQSSTEHHLDGANFDHRNCNEIQTAVDLSTINNVIGSTEPITSIINIENQANQPTFVFSATVVPTISINPNENILRINQNEIVSPSLTIGNLLLASTESVCPTSASSIDNSVQLVVENVVENLIAKQQELQQQQLINSVNRPISEDLLSETINTNNSAKIDSIRKSTRLRNRTPKVITISQDQHKPPNLIDELQVSIDPLNSLNQNIDSGKPLNEFNQTIYDGEGRFVLDRDDDGISSEKSSKKRRINNQDYTTNEEKVDDIADEDEYRPLKKRKLPRRRPSRKTNKSMKSRIKKNEFIRLKTILYKVWSHQIILKRLTQMLITMNGRLMDKMFALITGDTSKSNIPPTLLMDSVRLLHLQKNIQDNDNFIINYSEMIQQYHSILNEKNIMEENIDKDIDQKIIDQTIGKLLKSKKKFSMWDIIGEHPIFFPGSESSESSTNAKTKKSRAGRVSRSTESTGDKTQTEIESPTKSKSYRKRSSDDGEDDKKCYLSCPWPNCTYESKREWALNEHINLTHTGVKQFGCKVDGCPATFFGSSELDNHMKKYHTDVASKEFMPCTWPGCNALFKSKLGLRAHVQVHKGENMIPCDWPGCNYLAKNKRQHENHTRKHTGDRPFSCDFPGCDSKFRTNDSLRHHKKSHSEYRPFRCDWPGCEANFKTNRGLTIHRALHTGEKLFKCDWANCDYASERKYHVDLHIYENHTHVKPYQCTWAGCDASFLRNDKLQNHLKIHRQEKPFKCIHPSCDKHFVEKGNMMKHYNNVHKR